MKELFTKRRRSIAGKPLPPLGLREHVQIPERAMIITMFVLRSCDLH